MTKKKTNSENEMPAAEMPMENSIGGEMAGGADEMPRGNMMDGATESFSSQMPGEFSAMPVGNMMADTLGQMATMVGEMPQASMTSNGSTALLIDQNLSGDDEMPTGNMNDETTPYNAKQDTSKTIEIPGNWKLQLTYSS